MELFSRDNVSISEISAEALKKRIVDMVVKLRKEKGLSQDNMAESFGLSQNAYSKIESLKTDINIEKLFKFCEILKITLTELLGLDQVISVGAHNHIKELQAKSKQQENELQEKSMMIRLLSDKLTELEKKS